MKLDSMIYPWPERPRTDVNMVIVECKCPKCKKVLRLPLKKGTHTCKCPVCNNKFEVKCRRGEKVKVEVIKNK